LWIQRDHTLDLESVLLADGVKGRVLIPHAVSKSFLSVFPFLSKETMARARAESTAIYLVKFQT
jgi:hypothetical protein